MNPRGARSILSSKVKLGADASAAAGPKGRTANASTDATLRAEVLSYSRARGLFAGLSLEGSTVRPDNDANERIYGKKVEAESIVFKGAVAVPPAAQKMIAYLNQRSPRTLRTPNLLSSSRNLPTYSEHPGSPRGVLVSVPRTSTVRKLMS